MRSGDRAAGGTTGTAVDGAGAVPSAARGLDTAGERTGAAEVVVVGDPEAPEDSLDDPPADGMGGGARLTNAKDECCIISAAARAAPKDDDSATVGSSTPRPRKGRIATMRSIQRQG